MYLWKLVESYYTVKNLLNFFENVMHFMQTILAESALKPQRQAFSLSERKFFSSVDCRIKL